LILAAALIMFNPTLALTSEAEKQKAEALLKILEDDNATVAETLNKLEAQNVSAPQEAEAAYSEGLTYAQKAANLMEQESFSQAAAEAVQAMQKFGDALKALEDVSLQQPEETEAAAAMALSLKANITRTAGYVAKLENLTTRAAAAGYNTTLIERRLSEAKQHLKNAVQELEALNLKNAIRELSTAKKVLDELSEPYTKLTNLVKATNTRKYLETTEVRVTAIKANITVSAALAPEVKQEAITALNKSELSLANAWSLVEVSNLDDAIEELEEAKKWEEESIRAISSVNATSSSSTSVVPTTNSFTNSESTKLRP